MDHGGTVTWVPSSAMAAAVAATIILSAGCGGGSPPGESALPPPPAPVAPPPPVNTQAYRFLNQATFGATEASALRFGALDDLAEYGRWIDEQLAAEPSVQLPYVQAALPSPIPAGFRIQELNEQRRDIWFQNVLHGDDQLRQRVAWALSQIMVVSQVAAQRVPVRARGLLRHAVAQRARRFPHADGRRDAASDDGRVPLDARQPETGPDAQHPPRRKLRARVPAAVHRRPRAAQPRRHAAARRARTKPFRRSTNPSSKASRTCSRAGDGRAPQARRPTADSTARARPPRTRCCPMQAFAISTRRARSGCWRIRARRARSCRPGRRRRRTWLTRSTTSSTTRTSARSSGDS